MVNVILLVFWLVIGTANLCSSAPISKLSYFCTWIVVIAYFASRVFA
jgi:hypothetical protein